MPILRFQDLPAGVPISTDILPFVSDPFGAAADKRTTVANLRATLQTNGLTNATQNTLNLVAGTNITLTDNGLGSVTVASSGGGGGGFPVPDNTEGVFGTTYPFGLQSSTTGVNGSARLTIPDGKILVISKQSDIGIDYIDVPVSFSGPTIFIAGESGLANEGLVLGSGTTPFGDAHTFVLQTFGGDNLDGSPENADGTSLQIQASDGGSLGGVAGNIGISAGGVNFGNQDGGYIILNGGHHSGTGDVGGVNIESVDGFGGNLVFSGGNQPGLSQGGDARLYYDNIGNALMLSANGGAYVSIGGGAGGDLVSATLATTSGATANTINNSAGVFFDIPAQGVDAFNHVWSFGTANQLQFQVQGTFDGVGGLATGLLVFGTPAAPSAFTFIGGDAITPTLDALDWIYQGGKGGHNNPSANAGRGSNFQAQSGDGGDGPDNSHAPGDAGSMIFSGGTGGTGNPSFPGGSGGTVTLLAGTGGASGGSGVGSNGDVVFIAGAANTTYIGANGTIVTTVNANESNAWDVRDNSVPNPSYIQVNTNTGIQSINFGNITNNPAYNFLGNGLVDITGGLHVNGAVSVQGPVTTHGAVDMQLGPFSWTVEKVASLLAGVDALQTNTFTIPDLGADSSAIYIGVQNNIATNPLSHNLTGQIVGNDTQILVQQGLSTVASVTGYGSVIAIANAGTVSQVYGFTSFLSDAGAGTVVLYDQFLAKNPINPTGGTVTGLHIENLTNGTNNYGIVIDGASTLAMWVKNGNARFDGDVSVATSSTVSNFNVGGGFALIGNTSGDFIQAAAAVTTPYSVTWPAAQGGASTVLTNDGSGNLNWVAAATGTVTGPSPSTDRAIATWNGTSGTVLYDNPSVTIDSSGNLHLTQLLLSSYSVQTPTSATTNYNLFTQNFTDPTADSTAVTDVFKVATSFGAGWTHNAGDFVTITARVVDGITAGHTAASVTGFSTDIEPSGAGTTTLVRGYNATYTGSASSVVTTYEGMHVAAPSLSGGATIGTAYGLHVENITGATTDYGIVVEGATTKSLWIKGGVSQFDAGIVVNDSVTATSGTHNLQFNTLSLPDPGANSSATFVGIENDITQAAWSHNLTGSMIGYQTTVNIAQNAGTAAQVTGYSSVLNFTGSGEVLSMDGFVSSVLFTNVTADLDSIKHFHVKDTVAVGDLFAQYGFYVDNLTGGDANYGLVIEGASTKSIWVKAGDSEFDGNVAVGLAGKGFQVKEGANAKMGTATLVGGTVTVSTTAVTANSRIFLTVNGGTLLNVGSTYISARTAATSFTISSTNVLDSSNVAWIIIEPA